MLADTCSDDVFRNGRYNFVPAYYEGIMIGIAQNIEKYREDPALIAEKIEELKTDTDFKKYSGSASNSKNRIKKRLERANTIFGG